MDNLDTGGLPSVNACLLIILIALLILLGVNSIKDQEGRERNRRLRQRHVRNEFVVGGKLQARRIRRKRSSLLDSRRNKLETDILAGLFNTERDSQKGEPEGAAQIVQGEGLTNEELNEEDIFCETVEDAQPEVGKAEKDGSDLVVKKRSSKPRMSKRRRRDIKKASTDSVGPNSDFIDKISN